MSDYVKPPWYANGHAVYMGADGGFSLRCCPNPEDNARYIVHCVNNHEKYIQALSRLVWACKNLEYEAGRVDIPLAHAESLLEELKDNK